MRAIEAHLKTLPLPPDPPRVVTSGWWWQYADALRDQGWVDYQELASAVYDANSPTRSQLSAVARAVASLAQQGKVERQQTGRLTEQEWSRSVPGRGRRRGQQGTRRGFTVRRETLVRRLPASDPRK
jgi:hypothetical protein